MWRGGMRLITSTRVGLPSTAPAALAVLPQWALGLSSLALQRAASTAPASSAAPAQPYFITEAPAEAEEPAKRKWGKSTIRSIRGHTKKLNPVARQISGLAVNEAAVLMAFSQQKRARDARKALERAARNADFHHDIPSDLLIVDRAWTCKHLVSGRIRNHNKGRAGRSHYRTSTLNVSVREMTPEEAEKKKRFKSRVNTPEQIAALHPRGY